MTSLIQFNSTTIELNTGCAITTCLISKINNARLIKYILFLYVTVENDCFRMKYQHEERQGNEFGRLYKLRSENRHF